MAKNFKEANNAVIITKKIDKITDIGGSNWFSIGKVIFYKDFDNVYYHLGDNCNLDKSITKDDLIHFRDNEGNSEIQLLEVVQFKFKAK